MAENKTGEIVIFKTADDKVSIDVRFEGETVWLTIDDMASLFEKSLIFKWNVNSITIQDVHDVVETP